MRVTIHIGTYKTATSAIQFGLARSGRVLAKVGAKYAEAGLNHALSKHLHLFDRVVDGGYNHERHLTHKGEDYVEWLVEELRDPAVDHLLISEEELSYPSPAIARYFEPLRDIADVEIVMVVRRQPEFLESLYLQFLKEPLRKLTATFDEFIKDPAYTPRGDFAALLAMWEDVFGADAITVIDFDDLKNGDVVTNFSDRLGLPRGLKSPDHHINPSVTPAAGELLRRIAKSAPNFPRMQLASILRDIEPGKGCTLLTADRIAEILEIYRESNRILAERYGVDLDHDEPPSKRMLTEAELDRQTADAGARIIAMLWKRTRKAAGAIQKISQQQQAAMDALQSMFRIDGDE